MLKTMVGCIADFKIPGFLIGGLLFSIPSISPYLAALLALFSELSLYRSDSIKGRAQELRRKLDFQDAFGWKISGIDLSDVWVRSPKSVKDVVEANKPADPYFASKTPPGNVRGLENISESAWWTKHLAESLGWICLAILACAGISTIIFLIVAIQTIGGQQARISVARIATAFIMLFISLGLVKLTLGYFGLSRKASASAYYASDCFAISFCLGATKAQSLGRDEKEKQRWCGRRYRITCAVKDGKNRRPNQTNHSSLTGNSVLRGRMNRDLVVARQSMRMRAQ